MPRPRKEPEHVQQSHYTNILMKINFAQPVIDPITRLAEAVQNSSSIDIFPVADSLSVIDASGSRAICLENLFNSMIIELCIHDNFQPIIDVKD